MYKLSIFFLVLLITSSKTFSQSVSINRKQIPILCYHQIRDWKPKDSRSDKEYIISPALFNTQMKMLADSGYHTVLLDELYQYLTKGKPLPSKPIMITFDDTNADQFTAARPVLLKFNFKAVYFIVTGKIGTHKWFMDGKQIKQLSDEGNIIGCHTYTHTNFRKLRGTDWETEIGDSKKQLEQITGRPVNYFAFPFGYWNHTKLPELHKLGFKAAFQLDDALDKQDPIMSIRRLIVPGYWNPKTLDHQIKQRF